jgi:hypothetical protein
MLAVALLVVAAMAGLVGSTAAWAQDEEPQPDATLRAVHASPGAPAVDLLIDGQPFVQNLTFGSASDYAPLPEGEYTLQIVPTGGAAENAVAETDLEVDAGQAYIVAAMNPLNEIELNDFEVNLDAVEPGKARVRVIHAAPGAEEVDIAITGGDELFGGVGEGDTTDYEEINAGTYSLDIKKDDEVIFTAENLVFEDGRVYDVFALGELANQTLNLLSLETSVSRPCSEVLGIGGAQDACLRVIHASPGSPAVDVYVNGSPVVENLAFGTGTEYLPIPAAEDVQLQVTATGAELDNAVIDEQIDLTAGQAYQVVATGVLDEIEATVSEVDLTPLPEGQSRVRVIHASPDAGAVDISVAEGPTLFEGVEFRDATEYTVVDSGDYTLEVRQEGEDLIALQSARPMASTS